MHEITLDSHYIKPHSVAGEKVIIKTRHPEKPYPKKSTDCDFIVYSFRAQDNSEVEILVETMEKCLGDPATKKNVGDKLSGKMLLIESKDRKSLKNPKKVHDSGRHNTNQIITDKYTYCELHLEYDHIVNSSDYIKLYNEKLRLIGDFIKKVQ